MHYGDLSTSTRLRVVPIFPQVRRASETRARVKITPREKRRVMPFLAWGDFHPPSRPRTELLDNSPHDSLRTAVQPFMRHLQSRICLVPRPHYYARPMRFGSLGPRKFLRPRQTRRSETLKGAFHLVKISEISCSAVNGTRFVGSSHWKIPRKSGKSKKVVPFSRLKFPNGMSCSIYVSRSLYQFQVHGRAPPRTGVYYHRNFRVFFVNGKRPLSHLGRSFWKRASCQ